MANCHLVHAERLSLREDTKKDKSTSLTLSRGELNAKDNKQLLSAISDEGPAGIESNSTNQQLAEPIIDAPSEIPVTSKDIGSLKCPLM